jgi:hypothetical protein
MENCLKHYLFQNIHCRECHNLINNYTQQNCTIDTLIENKIKNIVTKWNLDQLFFVGNFTTEINKRD